MPVLYDQFGRPINRQSKPTKRPLPVAPVLSSSREYVADGLTPEGLAFIYREADGGNIQRQAELFDQLLEKDCHLKSEEQKRVNGITSQHLDWQFTPASDSQRDLDVVNFLEKNVIGHEDWSKYKVAQQDAVCKGYAGIAPQWDTSEGQAVVSSFSWIPQKRLIFRDPATGLLSDYPRLATDEQPNGEYIPAWSLILHKQGGLPGHPVRSALFRAVTWMVIFKHFSVKDWWVFGELCGVPLRIGVYDSGSSLEDRNALERAVRGVGSDFAAVISANTQIKFEQAAKNISGAKLWELQTTFCNNEMSKAIIGSSAFSEAGKSGSYAIDTLETGVRADLILGDAQACASTDIDQLIRPLVGFNFGWNTPLPVFRPVLKRQENLKVKSEWLESVADRLGGQMPLSWYKEQYGIPELQDGDRTVADAQTSRVADLGQVVRAKVATGGSRSARQSDIDGLVDSAVETVDLSRDEDAILALIRKSTSYEEVYAGLAGLYPRMDMAALRKGLAESLLMAQVAGVKAVKDNA